jgi:hypothetical protein
MPSPAMLSMDPLSRLLDVLQPSLAMYLGDSGIWSYPGGEAIKLALADLVGDHRSLVGRAAAEMEDRGIVPVPPAYPITFTGCHDVDIRSLVPRVIADLRCQVAALDAIIESGGDDTVAAELAREARASSLRHIDVLEQVKKSTS